MRVNEKFKQTDECFAFDAINKMIGRTNSDDYVKISFCHNSFEEKFF